MLYPGVRRQIFNNKNEKSLVTYQYVNFKLYYLDNVKGPHERTSVDESKKLYGSRGDEDKEMLIEVLSMKPVTRENSKSARTKKQ